MGLHDFHSVLVITLILKTEITFFFSVMTTRTILQVAEVVIAAE